MAPTDPSTILALISTPVGAAALIAVLVPFVLRSFIKPFLPASMRLPGAKTMAVYALISLAIGVLVSLLMLATGVLQATFGAAVLVGLCGAWESVSRLLGNTVESKRK
jgi:hypothetical protein